MTVALRLAAWGVPIIALAVCVLKFDVFQIGAYVDDAQYVVLAKSILEGDHYGLIDGPGAPQSSKYPFGWPLILAVTARVFGWSLEAPKVVSLCFTIANVVLLISNWRALGFASRSYGVAAAALFGFSHTVVGLAGTSMSEAAALFFVLVSLILTSRIDVGDRTNRPLALLLGAAWLMAFVVRTIGGTAVAACALWLAARRKWRAVAVAGTGALALLLVISATTAVDVQDVFGSSRYVPEMNRRLAGGDPAASAPGLPSLFLSGASRYATNYIPSALVPFSETDKARGLVMAARLGILLILLPLVLAFLLLVGAISDLRRQGLRAEHLYVPAHLAVVAVWPWWGERFLYGVLPFLFVYLLQGIHVVAARVTPRWPRLAPAVVTAACVVLAALQFGRSVLIQNFLDHMPDLKVGMDWIARNTPDDAVLMAEQTQSVYLYSGRKAVPMTSPESVSTAAPSKPDYVVIAPALVWREDGSLVFSQPSSAMLSAVSTGMLPADRVFEDEGARVYVYKLLD